MGISETPPSTFSEGVTFVPPPHAFTRTPDQTEERYRSLFESIDDGYCVFEVLFDGDGFPVDYVFLEVNPAFVRQTGLEDPVGKRIRELVPEHEQYWFDLYGAVAVTGESVRVERLAAGLDHRWYNVYAVKVGGPESRQVAAVFNDITARKNYQRRTSFLSRLSGDLAMASTEAEIIYTTVSSLGRELDADRCYFVECDEAGNRIAVSRNWTREGTPSLEGEHSLFDFGGIDWWRSYSSGDFAVDDVDAHPLTEEKAGSYRVVGVRSYAVQPFRHKSERTTVLAVTDSEARRWTGEELSLLADVVARVWPLVERARTEQSLRRAVEEAAQASRAKDGFLAALSHELRTPLTPVLMTTFAMQSDPDTTPEQREQLEMMRRNIELEARLIDDLLDLTRIRAGKMQIEQIATDLHRLLEHTAEIVRSDGAGKWVRLELDLAAETHHALADPTRLQQVFWNIIKNALKFTPEGGRVSVRTRAEGDDRIRISVEDTGIGIAPELLPYVFNAFEQGDATGQHRFGGLGLGLAISQAIIVGHGGQIIAESEGMGRGSRFSVILNAVAPVVPAHPAAPAEETSVRNLRILLVEDHEDTRTVLSRLLTAGGHEVIPAGLASEAIAMFHAHEVDLVISDLGLPDRSGLDLMRDLQKARPVTAIALSGYGMEDDLRQTQAAGFAAHLVKPVNFADLHRVVGDLAAASRGD